jgi:hypothetical protein
MAKPPEGIEIAVECGYDGYVQKGRVNPVTVTMRNATSSLNISGELVLSYGGVEYIAPLELPTPSEKRFFLYFPCEDYSPQLTLRVRSKQYTDEFTLFEPGAFKTMEADDASVVVLSRQQGALSMLNQKSIARLYRNQYKSESSQLSSGRVFVSYYRPDQVDPNAKFFGRADLIVLADIDYQQVTPELGAALRQAVSSGTGLVFSMGLSGAGIAGSPIADLCPLRYESTTQVGSLGQFGQKYGIAPKGAPAVLAKGKLAGDAEVLDSAGPLPVVAQAQRGSGTVTALAFDITAAPFKRNAKLAAVFLDNALQIEDTANIGHSFMHPWPVQLLLGKLSEAKPMTPGFVFLYLLAYIVLIGPLNFLILDRFKRRTLVWTTIPALIVAFSWVGMQTGYLRRGANNIAAYVQELHVYPGAEYAPYQTVMLLFTARRADYRIELQDASSYLYAGISEPRDLYDIGRQSAPILASRGKLITEDKPLLRASQGQWDQRSYAYTGNLPQGGRTASNLSAVPSAQGIDELQGTFTLDLPVDLKDCRLYAPQFNKSLGDLPGKGTYDVAQATGATALPADSDNYLWDAEQRTALETHLKNSAQFNLYYRDEVLLIGFTDKLDTLPKLSARSKTYTLGIVVVHLPYRTLLNTDRVPEVRTVLTGGSGFELRDEYGFGNYNYGRPADTGTPWTNRRYTLQPGSYLELTCTVSGRVSRGDELLLRMRGYADNNQPLSDLRNYVQVQYLTGERWLRVPMSEAAQVDLPLGGRHEQRVRVVATTECVLELPAAEILPE